MKKNGEMDRCDIDQRKDGGLNQAMYSNTLNTLEISRRDMLKGMAGAGMLLGLGSIGLLSLGSCSSSGNDGPPNPNEARTYFFDLSGMDTDHCNYVLYACGQKIPLLRTTREVLAQARNGNRFLNYVTDANMTHYCSVELPSHCITMCHVRSFPKSGNARWTIALMFIHVPRAYITKAHHMLREELKAIPSAKLSRFVSSVPAGHDVSEEADFIEATDNAMCMVYSLPEITSFDTTSSSYIQQVIGKRMQFKKLSTDVSNDGDNWATYVTLTDSQGNPMKDSQGNLVQMVSGYSDDIREQLGPTISDALKELKNDPNLGYYSADNGDPSGAMWVVDDGVTHFNQSPAGASGISAAGIPPAAAVTSVLAGQPFKYKGAIYAEGLPTLNVTSTDTGKGYDFSVTGPPTQGSSGDLLVPIHVKNTWSRYLGLYVRWIDADKNPIPISTIGSDFFSRNEQYFMEQGYSGTEPTTCDYPLAALSPTLLVGGIPVHADSTDLTVPVPQMASGFQVIAHTLGIGSNDYPGLDMGATLTSVLSIAIPILFLGADAASAEAAYQKAETAKRKLQVLEVFFDLVSVIVEGAYDPSDENAMIELGKEICELILENLTSAFGIELTVYIAEGDITVSIPIVGLAFEAISITSTLAQLSETVGEVLSSPKNYVSTVTEVHVITTTIYPDPLDPKGFPAEAAYYTVSATCKFPLSGGGYDNASPVVYTGQMPPTQQTDPIPITMTVPWGGEIEVVVGFYSSDGWLAGSGATGVVDNTQDTFSITITENKIPITASTSYYHKEKTVLDGSGNHVLLATPISPVVPSSISCGQVPGELCQIVNLTNLNTSPGGVGYAWQATHLNLSPCGGSGNTQMYAFANIGVTATPQVGYFHSCGVVGMLRVAYTLMGNNNFNFYVDDQNYIRQIRLNPSTAGYDSPSSNKAWGRLNLASDCLLLTQSGKIVSLNKDASHIESLPLPNNCTTDANAKLATLASGPGTRPGLISGPVNATILSNDVILILETGTNQVQAFDSAGNPVKAFPKQTNQYAFPLKFTTDQYTYIDMAAEYTGYVYLLSYASTGAINTYYLDIYDPDGNWVCRTTNFNGVKMTVSYWRDVYVGNIEVLKLNNGEGALPDITEPSISHWVATTP